MGEIILVLLSPPLAVPRTSRSDTASTHKGWELPYGADNVRTANVNSINRIGNAMVLRKF
jgi:hypothetical protein